MSTFTWSAVSCTTWLLFISMAGLERGAPAAPPRPPAARTATASSAGAPAGPSCPGWRTWAPHKNSAVSKQCITLVTLIRRVTVRVTSAVALGSPVLSRQRPGFVYSHAWRSSCRGAEAMERVSNRGYKSYVSLNGKSLHCMFAMAGINCCRVPEHIIRLHVHLSRHAVQDRRRRAAPRAPALIVLAAPPPHLPLALARRRALLRPRRRCGHRLRALRQPLPAGHGQAPM